MSKSKPLVQPVLDLNKRHFEAPINGLIVVGSWLRINRRHWEPCLVLLHGMRPIKAGKTVPIIIQLKDAWRWAMHGDVGDPAHCVGQIITWLAEGLLPGSPGNKADHMRIMDAINRRLPDLIAMPPRPKGDEYAVAEVTMLDKTTGEVISQREIKYDA